MADLKLKILIEAADRISAPFRRAAKSTDQLRSALKGAAEKVRHLERASDQIGAFARLKTEARASATALAAAQAKAQALGRQLAATGGGTRKAQAAFAAARREVDRLKQAKVSIARETATMRQRLRDAGVDTRKLADAQRQLKRDLDAARAAAARQASTLDQARARTEALAKARGKLAATRELQGRLAMGGGIAAAGGAAAMALGSRVAMAGIGFDEQMSAVGAVARLDKTGKDFQALRDLAAQLGETTSFSASEAAGGLRYLAMAGFDAKQMLAAMPGVLNLAKAGATDLGTASDIASNILSGFGLQASEMDRVGDVLTATFTRSNVNLGMLGDTMKYAAPIARQFGASIEDVAAMSGLLGNVGIQGEQAGTALRTLFARMASPPKEAQDALAGLGIATRDAQGNMRSMTGILAEVAKATAGMGSGARLEAFTRIAGMEAGASLAQLVTEQGEDGIGKFVEVLQKTGGESARVARQMGDNAAGDIKAFQSAVEGLNIALTDTNTGALRGLIQGTTEAVRGISAWVKENPELAGGLAKVAAGIAGVAVVGGTLAVTIAGILGPFAMAKFALTAIGIKAGFVGGALGMLGTVGTTVLGGLATGIKVVGAAFLTNPIGLAIAAIAAAAGLIYVYWEPIKGFFAGLWNGVKSAFSAAWSGLATILSFSPLGLLVANWEPVRAFFAGLWDGIAAAFSTAWDVIRSGIAAISAPLESISGIFGTLKGAVGTVFGGQQAAGTAEDKPPLARTAEQAKAIRPAATPIKIASTAAIAATVAAPLAAAQPAPAAAPVNMGGVTIVVQAAPGQSEAEIAKAVRLELEKLEARRRTDSRAALYDRE